MTNTANIGYLVSQSINILFIVNADTQYSGYDFLCKSPESTIWKPRALDLDNTVEPAEQTRCTQETTEPLNSDL